MRKQYVQAVLALIREGHAIDTSINSLKAILQQHGHMRLFAGILKNVLKELQQEAERQAPRVVVVKASDVTSYAQKIKESLVTIKATEVPSIIEDPTIVGGFIVEYRGSRIDASYKTKLLELYRSITA